MKGFKFNFDKSQFGILFYFLGFLGFYFIFCPGLMQFDPIYQYSMSLSSNYSDWHPPIMAIFWSFLNLFFNDHSGMLVFHLALFWIATCLFYLKYKDFRYSWLILLIGFFPWVINFLGIVWKDTGLFVTLYLVAAISLYRGSFFKIVVVTLLLFYALLIRFNSFFAILPILYFIFNRWFNVKSAPKNIIFSIAFLFVLFFLGKGLYSFYDIKKTNSEKLVIYDDLAFMSILDNKNYIDIDGIDLNTVIECERINWHERFLHILHCLAWKRELFLNISDANPRISKEEDRLKKDIPYFKGAKKIWLSVIFNKFLDYFVFRFRLFSSLLKDRTLSPFYILYSGDSNFVNPFDRQPFNFIYFFVGKISLIFPFFFKPYFWLMIGSVFFLITFLLEKSLSVDFIRILLISAISYILGYFPMTVTTDFRYVYWSVCSITLALILLLSIRPKIKAKVQAKEYMICFLIVLVSYFILEHGKISLYLFNNRFEGIFYSETLGT